MAKLPEEIMIQVRPVYAADGLDFAANKPITDPETFLGALYAFQRAVEARQWVEAGSLARWLYESFEALS